MELIVTFQINDLGMVGMVQVQEISNNTKATGDTQTTITKKCMRPAREALARM